ncbi:hypothetical protein [Colwellia sp. PAMC 21821]|uniref:hypothetical protein n=1 Tax=Colwellia sp. PAMC 21821 TaxID=1816219 RepID=UPI0009C1610C|nr:hypothetical protein [Colwellia sp. PAMC 21821]ARD44453.1 hypothetical protein A3Q33_09120 [Colwellia sp. PAMC 21821]
MDWNTVLTAIMAGGIVGQLLTLFWGNKLTIHREFSRWIETERLKAYSELLTIVTLIPKSGPELDIWTYQIRDVSQRIHLLFDGGVAPREFKRALELIFKFSQEKKDDKASENWSEEFRVAVRDLRKEMSSNIKK